jgi:hypothetical protein
MSPTSKVNIPVTSAIKKLLTEHQGKAGAAAGLIAGTVFVSGRYFSPILEKEPQPVAEVQCVDDAKVACTDGTFVATEPTSIVVTSNQLNDFESEFAQQREAQGPGGIFEYNGKMYNTYFKEEWESMDTEARNAYYDKVGMGIKDQNLQLVVSDGQGNTSILTYNDQNIMGIQVVDSDQDGIIDIVHTDINMDGNFENTYTIEKVIVQPVDEVPASGTDVMIDDSEINPSINEEIETVSPEDQTMINPESGNAIEDQNIINDDEIGKYNLPGIIDDMNMDEFL